MKPVPSYRNARWRLAAAFSHRFKVTLEGVDLAVFADRSILFHQKSAMSLITYLAEDNATILTNLIETLQEITEVKVIGCGATQAEAVRWLSLHDGHWHLAIVDLFLKEGSGLAVLSGCRHREPYQKVVLLTNYATPEIRKRAAALGADAVFDKSSELDELLAYCIEQTAEHKKVAVQEAERVAIAKSQSQRREAGASGTMPPQSAHDQTHPTRAT